MKHMTIKEWKKREFEGKPLDNRTIKKYISEGKLVGIVQPQLILIRVDQTLDMLNPIQPELDELLRLSA